MARRIAPGVHEEEIEGNGSMEPKVWTASARQSRQSNLDGLPLDNVRYDGRADEQKWVMLCPVDGNLHVGNLSARTSYVFV